MYSKATTKQNRSSRRRNFILPTLWILCLAVSVGLFVSAADNTTIKYDLNGVAPTVYTEAGGSSVTVPTIDVSFDGMAFKGWNTRPDGSGTSVSASDRLDNSTTLYAQWSDGTHLDSTGATTRNADAKPDTTKKAAIDTDITSKSNQSSSNPDPEPNPKPSDDDKCDAKESDLDKAVVTYDGEDWADFKIAESDSVTGKDASKVKIDFSNLTNKDCWSAWASEMSDEDTVIIVRGRQSSGQYLTYRHHFLEDNSSDNSNKINDSANNNKSKEVDGSEKSKPTVSTAKTAKGDDPGNNSAGGTKSSSAGAPTAGIVNGKLTAPIALVGVGIASALAVLKLTGGKVDCERETTSTNRIILNIQRRISGLTDRNGYAITMSVAVLAILAGSFMLSGYKINAKEIEDYSSNVKAASEYTDASGNPYNGFVTIHNMSDDTVANRKTYWWHSGAKKTGELSSGDHYWQYFDPEDDGAMARNKERIIPTTAGNKKWVFYNDEGYMVYGWRYLADGKKWVYYQDDSGEMIHGQAYLYQNNEERLSHNDSTPRYWYYFDDATGATTYGWKFLNDSPQGWVYYEENTGRMLYGNRTLPRHPEDTSEQSMGDSSRMTQYVLDANTGRATEVTIAQHIVNLARATAGTTGTPGGYTVGSGHDAWAAPSSTRWANDPGLQRYEKVFRATVTRMGGNGALASCAQAVSAILAATVDQYAAASNNQNDQKKVMAYLAANPDLYENLGTIPAGQRQPGDIQVSGGHVSIFISKHSGSGADIWEAHYGGNGGEKARYPSIENHGSDDYVGMQVFRAKATATPIDVSSIVTY